MKKNSTRIKEFDLGTGYNVTLLQSGIDRFTVAYGLQVKSGLTYAKAAQELGENIFHALACAGKLDNR